MGEWVDGNQFGYGFGPMTSSFEDELSENMGADYTELGDTPGATYLKWTAGDEEQVTAWGYFEVYGYGEGSLIDFEAGPVAGVRDSATPSDGYYAPTTMYILSFGEGK
jgi:hypothetical protein